MTIRAEKIEIDGVVGRLLDSLALTISSQTGATGILLRQKIGDLRSNYIVSLYDKSFSTKLLDCFTTARLANAKLSSLASVREDLFIEDPSGVVSQAIILTAIVFCLSAEARMITSIEFVSRDDVDVMMKRMKLAFDTARELAADSFGSAAYQTLTFLAGSLTNHLANIARPLPRMMTFTMNAPYPALFISNRIYYTAERWEEVAAENKVIHPLFCQINIVGLSS